MHSRILAAALLLPLLGNAAAARRPKLVVAITVDQFRYDYLTRFRSEYNGGLDRLLKRGAVFSNAYYDHFPTVTAVGHSTLLSGAFPAVSGIIGNEWFDRESGKNVTSVSDEATKLLGGQGTGSSPRRLMVSTLGDELKIASGAAPKVFGMSFKDRSAILPAGHMANGAFWMDNRTGSFVSSTFYGDDLPAWVKDFNASQPADQFLGKKWVGGAIPTERGPKFFAAVYESPFGNELLEQFAERAIAAEQLGKRGVTDILTVSFSSNDAVGHDVGPDSPEVHQMSVETDRVLDRFFRYLDQQVGMDNVLVVLTADHGIAPVPEVSAARKMPGGRMQPAVVQSAVQAAISAKYGQAKWILSSAEHSIVFDPAVLRDKKVEEEDFLEVAASAARAVPHVARVYTRTQLLGADVPRDAVGVRVLNGYNPRRGPDLVVVLDPYWMYAARGTTHGSPYGYDAHVPVVFMGPGIKAGLYRNRITPNDIAPTLAALLDLDSPSGAAGRVLQEIFAPSE